MIRKAHLKFAWDSRKYILSIGIPFLLLPWPLVADSKEVSCAYVVLIMALFWLLEIVPLAITALLPVFMFPLMGVLTTDEACKPYMTETLMIFIGSLMAATAVEHCNLHHRIALKVLLLVGSSPRWLLLGFMATTTILSMWISNSATTALMVPIVEAVLLQLTKKKKIIEIETIELSEMSETEEVSPSTNEINLNNRLSVTSEKMSSEKLSKEESVLRRALYLGVCYSANVGGTGTLTGTTPNLILQGIIEDNYPDYHELTFSSWLLFNFPGAILCMISAWVFLQVIYLRRCETDATGEANVKIMIREKYNSLGKMSFHEKAVASIFVLMIILFFFRAPEFIPGWAGFRTPNYLKDAVTAIFIVFLMFIIPADPSNISKSPPLLEWKVCQEKVSWGLVLLLGGGFALAEATKKSGLSAWLATELSGVNVGSTVALQLLICSIALVLTEVTSNTATCTILLPVILKMAEMKEIHPLTLMMPVCICCSYAFMLPIATGPNAIVFDSAKFSAVDMAIPGVVMKLVCLAIIILMMNTLGQVVFTLDTPILKSLNSTNVNLTNFYFS